MRPGRATNARRMPASPQYSPHSPQYSPHSPQSPVPSEAGEDGVYAGVEDAESLPDFYARMRHDLDDSRKKVRRLRGEETAALEIKAEADDVWYTARDTVDNCTATFQVLPSLVSDLMQGAMYIYKEGFCYTGAVIEEKLSNGIKRKRSDARDRMDKARKAIQENAAVLRRLNIEISVANANAAVLEGLL